MAWMLCRNTNRSPGRPLGIQSARYIPYGRCQKLKVWRFLGWALVRALIYLTHLYSRAMSRLRQAESRLHCHTSNSVGHLPQAHEAFLRVEQGILGGAATCGARTCAVLGPAPRRSVKHDSQPPRRGGRQVKVSPSLADTSDVGAEMSTVAEALLPFTDEARRIARFREMLTAVLDKFERAVETPSDFELWMPYMNELTAAAERLSPRVWEDWIEMEAIVEKGYRRLLFADDPNVQKSRFPRSSRDLKDMRVFSNPEDLRRVIGH